MRKLSLLSVFVLLLLGCVQYNEEMWLNRDGSGRMKMHIIVASTYQNTETVSKYANIKGIHLRNFKTYKNKENTYYDIELNFDNLEALNALNDQEGMANFIGRSELIKQKHGLLHFKRKIALGSTDIDDEDQLADLFQTIFTVNRNWSYTLHLPYEIVSANAEPGNVNYKEKSVKWNYELAYLWNKNQTMEVTMDHKISFLLMYVGLPALLLFLGIIFLRWRKRSIKTQTPGK